MADNSAANSTSPRPTRSAPFRSIRAKVAWIVAATTIGLIILLYISLNFFVLNSFKAIEEQAVQQAVQRALNALADDLAGLQRTATDYAVWDDTYGFLQDRSADYLEINYDPGTLVRNRVDVVLFLDEAGQIIANRQIDATGEQILPVPPQIQSALAAAPGAFPPFSETDGASGIVMSSEGPLMVAAWPVLTSANTGPARGTLLMARRLNDATLQRLSETTRQPLEIRQLADVNDDSELAAIYPRLSPTAPLAVNPLSDQRIAGYGLLTDASGSPALLLRIEQAREVYSQAQSSIQYFIWAIAAAGVIFGVVILLLLQKVLLSRVTRLNTQLHEIGERADLAQRVHLDGHDELTSVADNVNLMLSSIERLSDDLAAEQVKSGRSLMNTLPEHMLTQLADQSGALAASAVTVLAVDMVDNTCARNRLEPGRAISLLNQAYQVVDTLVKEYGAEKIRARDETYVAMAGLSSAPDDPADAIAQLALEIQRYVDNLNRTLNVSFQVRIGIHTGQLTSGAIGTQHFVLDLWGETLNVVTQVMNRCALGEIQVTQAAHDSLRHSGYFFDGGEVIYLRRAGKAVQIYRLTGGGSSKPHQRNNTTRLLDTAPAILSGGAR